MANSNRPATFYESDLSARNGFTSQHYLPQFGTSADAHPIFCTALDSTRESLAAAPLHGNPRISLPFPHAG